MCCCKYMYICVVVSVCKYVFIEYAQQYLKFNYVWVCILNKIFATVFGVSLNLLKFSFLYLDFLQKFYFVPAFSNHLVMLAANNKIFQLTGGSNFLIIYLFFQIKVIF